MLKAFLFEKKIRNPFCFKLTKNKIISNRILLFICYLCEPTSLKHLKNIVKYTTFN